MNLKKKTKDRRFGEIFPGVFPPHTVIFGCLVVTKHCRGGQSLGVVSGAGAAPGERAGPHSDTALGVHDGGCSSGSSYTWVPCL